MAKVRTVILTEECVPVTAIYCCHFVVLPVTTNSSDCHIMTELLG
jgi:hypothetical protein